MSEAVFTEQHLLVPYDSTLCTTTFIAIHIDLGTPPQRTWRELQEELKTADVDVVKHIQVVSDGVKYEFTFEDFMTRLGIPTE